VGEGVSAGAVCAKAGRAKANINATTAATVSNSIRLTVSPPFLYFEGDSKQLFSQY